MTKLDCYMSSCHLLCRYDWMKCLEWVHQAGFTGMECFDELNENILFMTPERMEAIHRKAEALNVKLSAHPWVSWAEMPMEKMVCAYHTTVENCAKMGVSILNMHLNFIANRQQGMNRIFEVTDAVLPLLKKHGIMLLYENVPEYGKREPGSEVGDFEKLFIRYGEDTPVMMNIDVGHAHIMHQLLPLAEEFGSRWRYTHINDNNQLKDEHFGPGMGTADWERCAQLASEIGYHGPLMMEYNQRYLAHSMPVLSHAYQKAGFQLDEIHA